MRIVFLGNPEFARYQLAALLEAGFNVVAVVSAPDKPAGRGMRTVSTPVTQFAREKGIPCLQPKNLKSPEFIEELRSYAADLQVVIAFRMLPEVVWSMPTKGTVNLHASLLPAYRGAAPINWAIINGETETGVTTFRLQHAIDTGNVLESRSCLIEAEDTAGSLHDKLMHLGADAIVATLRAIAEGRETEIPQSEVGTDKTAPKLYPETTKILWDQNGISIVNFVRGLAPYPVAKTTLDGKNVKIYAVAFSEANHTAEPGTFFSDGKTYLAAACQDGYIYLNDIQLQGKKRMSTKDLLNGWKLDHLDLATIE